MPPSSLQFLVLAASLALAGCGARSPEEHLSNAQQAIENNDLKTAEIELKSVLQAAPGNTEARLMLARAFQEKGSWEDSEKELRKALEQGVSPERALPMLARALMKLGRYQEVADLQVPASGMGSQAIAELQAERAAAFLALDKVPDAERSIAEGVRALAASGSPSSASSHLRLSQARLAIAHGQADEALAILNDILSKDAGFIEALYLKAQLLGAQGKLDEADKVYRQILSAKPNEILAHLATVEIKLAANDVAAAEKSLLAAEAIDANKLLVKYARAKLAFLKHELKQANEALQQVLRVAPDHLPSMLLDAQINYGLGNYEQSLKSANRVLAQVPGQPMAARLVAANELRMGNHKTAIEVLTPLLEADANDVRTLSLLGEAHLQARRYGKAMEYLERAASLQPKNPYFKERQARVHLAMGETDRALRELELATRMTDSSGQADMSLIMLLLGSKDYDGALKAIAALEKKLPNNPVTSNLRGLAYLGKGDRQAARRAFEQAMAIKPDFFPAAANLAKLDLSENRPDAARQRYESILKVDERNIQAMLALAELAATRHDEQGVLAWLEKAAQLNPTAIAPRAGLVRHHLAKKAHKKALEVATEAVNTHPDHPAALSLLGSAQMAVGDKTSALIAFTKVTQKLPNSAEAFYQLGAAQIAANKMAEGRTSLEKALALNPAHVAALDGLLLLDVSDKNLERALQRAREFQTNNPRSGIGYVREGDLLKAQRRFSEAIRAYEQAMSRSQDMSLFGKLHTTLLQAGNLKLAEQRLAERLARFPKDPWLLSYAAEYFLSQGRDKEAIRQYEALYRSMPDNAALVNNLALLYQRVGDARALPFAESAYRLSPDSPAVMDTLGWILLERGQTAKAVDLLKKAVDKAPSEGTLRYHYAVALARTGDRGQARKQLEALLASKRAFREEKEARAMLEGL